MNFLQQMMGPQSDENQDVEHQSGVSRMGSAVCCAFLSPFLMLACVILIGWNEKRAVCDSKAIYAGMEVVEEADCNDASANDGKLVLWSCKLDDPTTVLTAAGEFSGVSHLGYCLQTNSEMYLCTETVHSKTQKDSVGGGKTTVKTYEYKKEWSKKEINSDSFKQPSSDSFKNNCAAPNEFPWPSNFPVNGVTYANEAKAGKWTLSKDDLQDVTSCGAEVAGTGVSIAGFTQSGATFESNTPRAPEMNAKRVSFTGDKIGVTVTALGENQDGKVKPWTSPDSWLCSGYTLKDMRSGSHSKDELFEKLVGGNQAMTWALRIVFWLLLWLSCTCLGRPFEVAADCIPCIGPMLGDFVDAVVCCVTCLPSLACCAMVAGVVWVAMRPEVGAPIMIIGMCIICGGVGYQVKRKQDNKGGSEGGVPSPVVMGNVVEGGEGVFRGPVTPNVAAEFIQVLRVEYLGQHQPIPYGNVGDFFGANPGVEDSLVSYEDKVRDSPDRIQAIANIQREWNLNV